MRKPDSPKKPQAAQAAASKNENTKPVMQQAYWLLKSSSAKKIGKQSEGVIGYQILGDVERHSLHIVITTNANGGYFSREIVPFNKVKDCLNSRVQDKPFPSKLFREAFVGRSSNNAGFLAAILHAEGLLATAPDTETQHIVGDDWTAWQELMLAETGEQINIDVKQPDTKENECSSESDTMKSTKTLTLHRPKTDASDA